MSGKFSRILILSVSLSACGGGGGGNVLPGPAPSAQPSATPPSSAAQAIDSVIHQYYAGDWGVELAIYRDGALLYARGYGLRDRGLPDVFSPPNIWRITQPDQLFHMTRGRFAPDINTEFDLASVSKEFTAGAVLLLQQDGKLSVNDPLSNYFPNLPSASSIPLLYLLQHRSGFVDYISFGSYPDFTPSYDTFLASGDSNYKAIADNLAQFPLKFTPGTQYDYSNTNYLLLGMIVAKVSGEPLASFLEQRIFAPLGMTQTHQGYPTPPVDNLALGYYQSGLVYRTWQWNLDWIAGPGGLTSTVGDIEKWDRAVRQPGIFTASSLAQMFTPGPIGVSYGTYADGWFISSLDGHRYAWHDGALTGYQTMNATFPDDGIDIIVLTNDGSGTDPYFTIPQLFSIALHWH